MSQTDECISNLKINSCPSCYTTTILRLTILMPEENSIFSNPQTAI